MRIIKWYFIYIHSQRPAWLTLRGLERKALAESLAEIGWFFLASANHNQAFC